MALPAREIASNTAKAVGSFREAIQDLLLPAFRSMKVAIDSLRTEMQLRDERQTKASEGLSEQLASAISSLTEETRLRVAHQTRVMQALSEKVDFAIDIRERPAQVEARLPKH